MVKAKRGLPDGFSLGVNVSSPAILGDFLDEVAKPQAPLGQTTARALEAPAPKAPSFEGRATVDAGNAALATEPVEESVVSESSPMSDSRVVALNRVVYPKPPRLELSLNHDTKRMVQELLTFLQSMGPQPPAKASEMFQGIISVLYRAKKHLDLSHVPRRGQWGSPTAKAFPVALGDAFAKAIAEQEREDASKKRL